MCVCVYIYNVLYVLVQMTYILYFVLCVSTVYIINSTIITSSSMFFITIKYNRCLKNNRSLVDSILEYVLMLYYLLSYLGVKLKI